MVHLRRGEMAARSRPRGRARVAATSGLSTLLAITAHLVGGGVLPTSCATVATALAVAAAATWTAGYAAGRTRGVWAALLALGVGQLGIEALLSAPTDHLPPAPLAATAGHALATLVLAVVLLGSDHTLEQLREVLDRVLPRWWRVPVLPAPTSRAPHRLAFLDLIPRAHARCLCSPRSPPTVL